MHCELMMQLHFCMFDLLCFLKKASSQSPTGINEINAKDLQKKEPGGQQKLSIFSNYGNPHGQST